MNSHALSLARSSSQYASITDASQTGLDLAATFTIEAWVKFASVPISNDDEYVIVSKYNTGGNQRSYQLGLVNGVTLSPTGLALELLVASNGSTRDVVYCAWVPNLNQWYHVAATFTGANPVATEMEFFVDGVSKGNGTVVTDGSVTSAFDGTAPFMIGARQNSGSAALFFDGVIDEVRVWSTVRTAQQILDNKNVYFNSASGLVGNWHLDNNYNDLSGNNNHLTASGSPTFSTSTVFTLRVATPTRF